jgi:hypothetical protein
MIRSGGLQKDVMCRQVMELAQAKLLGKINIEIPFSAVSPNAKLAVVDVILMLDFEVRRENAQLTGVSLVASHMRTAFSVPKDLLYLRSGYPSEPIIAEAACRQLASWSKQNPRALLEILNDNLTSGLLDYGEMGELAGRALIWDAYRRAVEHDNRTTQGSINYSAGCPLTTFVEMLFVDGYAKIVLDSRPDNLNEGPTLREAFDSAKIRFTHFGRMADDSGTTTYAAWAAFMRSMAISCRSGQPTLDCLLPILLWDENLSEWLMSGILVQFKRRKKKGSVAAYAIDEKDIGFFPKASCSGCLNHGQEPHPDSRPYIVLVMEVGVQASLPKNVTTKTKFSGSSTNPAAKTKAASKKPTPGPSARPTTPTRGDFPTDVKTPSKVFIPQSGIHHHRRPSHPRYSIFAYGCSPTVYRGIGEEQRAGFALLLRSRDFLGEHARGDAASIAALRRMKPFWSRGQNCYHWIDCPQLQGGPVEAEESEYEGVFMLKAEDEERVSISEPEERPSVFKKTLGRAAKMGFGRAPGTSGKPG